MSFPICAPITVSWERTAQMRRDVGRRCRRCSVLSHITHGLGLGETETGGWSGVMCSRYPTLFSGRSNRLSAVVHLGAVTSRVRRGEGKPRKPG